jgi:hypothetical protein
MTPTTSLSQPRSNKPSPTASVSDGSDSTTSAPGHDTKLEQLQPLEEGARQDLQAVVSSSADREAPKFSLISKLLKTKEGDVSTSGFSDAVERSIRQAPLVAAGIVAEHYNDLVPQYGLLGSLEDEPDVSTNSALFLNTNVPFSAFICGVQGSGKSHTTSCVLEDSILASPYLGHLESPVSALVFSYGEWSGGGAGFNISEATFLGASHPSFPNHNVKEVTVLYSPSNPAIKRIYERHPNVQMVPFRLKAKTLDIGALHTLMAVDEKSNMPLYMVTVEAILRDMATRSFDGSLDYTEFKRRLAREKFDATQSTMLQMRMNLLDSFLDLDNKASMPDFKPGRITIIDLSDPFLTPSTACILFKLGLEQFLQSSAPGKTIVLDEAHKVCNTTSQDLQKLSLISPSTCMPLPGRRCSQTTSRLPSGFSATKVLALSSRHRSPQLQQISLLCALLLSYIVSQVRPGMLRSGSISMLLRRIAKFCSALRPLTQEKHLCTVLMQYWERTRMGA